MLTAECKLCRQQAELQKSHLVPKALYERLCDRKAMLSPIIMSGGTAAYNSHQLQAHLLCSACEQCLHREGENWVLRNSLQADDSFPLREKLESFSPIDSRDGDSLYAGKHVLPVGHKALIHFAVGVFFKADIFDWKIDRHKPYSLGPYQERLRCFLLNQEPFSEYMYLLVFVWDRPVRTGFRSMMVPQFYQRNETNRQYRFDIPGITFILGVGRLIQKEYQALDTVRSTEGYLAVSKSMADASIQNLRMMVPKVSKRGKLASQSPSSLHPQ